MPGTFTSIDGTTRVIINPAALAEMLRGPGGPVYRQMIEDGEKVKQEAIAIAPVGTPDPLGRPREDGSQPGNLRNHIVKRIARAKGGDIEVLVGVENVKYALGVHEGNPPHVIASRTEATGGLLVFFWKRTGTIVAFPRVNHPGNQPNRFLIRAMRVLSYPGATSI